MKFQMELMPSEKKESCLLLGVETGKKCRLANEIGFKCFHSQNRNDSVKCLIKPEVRSESQEGKSEQINADLK